jgi:hypothetical protein
MNKSGITVPKDLKLVFEQCCKLKGIGYTELTKVVDGMNCHYLITATHFQQVFELGVYFSQLGG